MPNYGVAQPGGVLTVLAPGDELDLFAAESPTAPQASVAFAVGYNPGGGAQPSIIFTASWATSPTAVLNVQASNVDMDAQYQTLQSFTNQQQGFYADGGGFNFYRVQLSSQSAGGAVTVKARRAA